MECCYDYQYHCLRPIVKSSTPQLSSPPLLAHLHLHQRLVNRVLAWGVLNLATTPDITIYIQSSCLHHCISLTIFRRLPSSPLKAPQSGFGLWRFESHYDYHCRCLQPIFELSTPQLPLTTFTRPPSTPPKAPSRVWASTFRMLLQLVIPLSTPTRHVLDATAISPPLLVRSHLHPRPASRALSCGISNVVTTINVAVYGQSSSCQRRNYLSLPLLALLQLRPRSVSRVFS